MPLTSMKTMLDDARQNRYAVGCFNAINLEMARGIVEAAEKEGAPVILCHAELHFRYTPLEQIAPVLTRAAENASVPVAVLLDHGKGFSSIIRAMHLGFNAVMFDGSRLPFAENMERTAEVVKVARELGVTVEAELGHVARPLGGGAEDEGDAEYEHEELHTKPEEAREFVEATGVAALAVAFGTAHGVYMSEPRLDFDRLTELQEAAGVPLVMHGGSGLSEQDFKKSIEKGICKINYYTGMSHEVARVIKHRLNDTSGNTYYHDVMMWSIEAFRDHVRKVLKVFGSSGRG